MRFFLLYAFLAFSTRLAQATEATQGAAEPGPADIRYSPQPVMCQVVSLAVISSCNCSAA